MPYMLKFGLITTLRKYISKHNKTSWVRNSTPCTPYLHEIMRGSLSSPIQSMFDVPKNHLSLAYLLHAYDVNDSTFKRLRIRGGAALPKQVPHNKGQSVMNDKEYAATIFNARNFFVKSQMRKWLEKNQQASSQRKAQRRKWLRATWDKEKEKDDNFGAAYDKKARDHAKRQEGTKDELVQIMNRNTRRSYVSLEKAMNNWCSWKTIERFLKSNDDFKTYSQNVRPLLSEGNRLKQVSLSKHVHNRWGPEPGQIFLWTMRYTLIVCCMYHT
jgi:hypothetical protein